MDGVALVGIVPCVALPSHILDIPPSLDVRGQLRRFLEGEDGPPPPPPPPSEDSRPSHQECAGLQCLPEEVALLVLRHCDLAGLCRAARACRSLASLCRDPLLFSELDLSEHWRSYRGALAWALPRCRRLRALDVSRVPDLDPGPFLGVATACGPGLRRLCLDSSLFVTGEVVALVLGGGCCPLLEDLSLANCRAFRSAALGAGAVGVSRLGRLNLYLSDVDLPAVRAILERNPDLRHLNLGACSRLSMLDEVMEVISKCNRKLRSLDLWKTGEMGAGGLQCLSSLTELQEVDLGWCIPTLEPMDQFEVIARSCTKLRKLFLGACRELTDRDLVAFVRHCPLLEQVDLMGIMQITPDSVSQLLSACSHLKYLDVSYCHLITYQVPIWRTVCPHVAIKQSSSDYSRTTAGE